MIRRLACLLLALLFFCGAAAEEVPGSGPSGADSVFPPEEYEITGKLRARYESDTLRFTIESLSPGNVYCILTRVWVQDPARQIRKASAPWGKSLADPMRLVKSIPGAALAVNASGYITKTYPDLPEGYPGVPEDYYFQTLGSLVVTDGEVFRNLEGVPFWGLALTADGITLYRGADNAGVLAEKPSQTWAFFENAVMQVNGENLLPEEGTSPLVQEKHTRTILARINRNNYVLMNVIEYGNSRGASLYWLNDYFSEHFRAEWVYNLDGGYSSSLIYRTQEKKPRLIRHVVNRQGIMDILCFTE